LGGAGEVVPVRALELRREAPVHGRGRAVGRAVGEGGGGVRLVGLFVRGGVHRQVGELHALEVDGGARGPEVDGAEGGGDGEQSRGRRLRELHQGSMMPEAGPVSMRAAFRMRATSLERARGDPVTKGRRCGDRAVARYDSAWRRMSAATWK